MPGTTVTATNQATNVGYTAVSNESGNYTIAALPIGTYVVKAELARVSRPRATKPIQLPRLRQIGRIDIRLELGGLEETVEVKSEGAGPADRVGHRRRGHLRDGR